MEDVMDLKQILIDWVSMPIIERKTLIAEQGDELLSNMLHEIGSVDAELRDQLIYRTFMEMLGGIYSHTSKCNICIKRLYRNNICFSKLVTNRLIQY